MLKRAQWKKEKYDRNPIEVAKDILGSTLVCNNSGQTLAGTITEVEGYLASGDAAAHSNSGNTKKTTSLFKGPGHAYIHRMHGWNLLDLVCKDGSVLIRSLKPIDGIKTMKQLRNTYDETNLTNGPGKLCQALHVTYELDGIDITTSNSKIHVLEGTNVSESKIIKTPRIGISKSTEHMLRFVFSQ